MSLKKRLKTKSRCALYNIYKLLLKMFGRQKWWPAETNFEIIIGAILTQRTNWKNVEKGINNLKKNSLLCVDRLANEEIEKIESCIRSVGFYKQKAKRIKGVAEHIARYKNLDEFFSRDKNEIREELLSMNGIGKETADSILLYAGNKRIFPVDAYTFRFCERFGFEVEGYEETRKFFENHLPNNINIYKEFHALIVELGKLCRKKGCAKCLLKAQCKSGFYAR